MKPQDEALLPCPFCGKSNVKVFGPYGWYRHYGISHSCRSFYSGAQELAQGFHSEADAINAWNTRAAIGMEAGTGETEGLDPKGDSPDPKGIAVNTGHSTPGDAEVRKALADLMDCLMIVGGNPAVEAIQGAQLDAAYQRAEMLLATPSGRAQAWLPIASAPKDGTFLAWFPDDGGRVDFCHWQDFGPGSTAPVGWRDAFINVYPEGHEIAPTHWQPLPAAPPAQDQGEGR